MTGPRLRSTSAIPAITTPIASAMTVATPAPASCSQGRPGRGRRTHRDPAARRSRNLGLPLIGHSTGEVLAKAGLEDVVGHGPFLRPALECRSAAAAARDGAGT